MSPVSHLTDAALLAQAIRLGGRLPARTRSHLEGCARCRQDLADLRALSSSVRDTASEPSAGVVARAWALLEPRLPRGVEASRFALARLVYDSARAPTAAALRAPLVARHKVWRSAAADLDVRIEGAGPGSQPALLGQVLPRGRRAARGPEGSVWLQELGRRPCSAPLTEQGEFTLPAPRGRRWSLWLEWGALRLRVRAS